MPCSHRWDYLSGWCQRCGKVRDDARTVSYYGELTGEGPTYTPAELDAFRRRGESILSRRYARAEP